MTLKIKHIQIRIRGQTRIDSSMMENYVSARRAKLKRDAISRLRRRWQSELDVWKRTAESEWKKTN